MQTTETLLFGTNEHGKPTFTTSGCWRRRDTYRNNAGQTYIESRFAAGLRDDSGVFFGTYDAHCSCCYLNFSHTIDSHNQAVRA